MIESLQRPDEELFRAFISGDPQAMATLVTRHTRGVYDFALRSTMDESQASDVTRNAFDRLKASREIPSQVGFRSWLYSLALVEVLAIANERRPARVAVEDRRFLRSDGEYDAELVLWSWQAARGLRTRDFCVLDLTSRRKMTPEDLADSASLTRSNLYASIGRARGAFEETFGATVLFMRGRQTCPELEAMVSATPSGSVRPALRHQISDHADTCEICRKTMAALPLASEVYVSLIDVDIPTSLETLLAGAPSAAAEPAHSSVEAATRRTDVPEAAGFEDERVVENAPDEDIGESQAVAPSGRELSATPVVASRLSPPSGVQKATYADEEDLFLAKDGNFDRYARIGPGRRSMSDRIGLWLDSVRTAPTWALGGVLTVIAIYIAIAVGQSIRGGGGDAGAVPLQSTARAGAAQTGEIIECGSGPIVLDHGTESVISFDPRALDGFTIGGLAVTPNSQAASTTGLRATAEGTQGIKFQAAKVQSTSSRTDQYLLRISWRKGNDLATSECPVTVRVSAAAP